MADVDLLVIVHSQDSFVPGAQELARKVLLKRGIPTDFINSWRHPTTEDAAPNWSVGESKSQIRQMFQQRRLLDRISIYLLVPISLVLLELYLLMDRDRLGKSSDWDYALATLSTFCWLLVGLLWLRILLLSLWRTPVRILFLRPFMFPESRRRTRLFTEHYLRHLGHTYTISDIEVKPRWAIFESLQFLIPILSAVPFSLQTVFSRTDDEITVANVLGMIITITVLAFSWLWLLFRTSLNIRSDVHLSRVRDFIGRKRIRNIAWTLSWDKLFKVSCTPETWKLTVQHMINSSQLIVVDISRIGDSLAWELEELRFYNSLKRVIAIAHEKSASSAQSFLAAEGLGLNKDLFLYDDNGTVANDEALITTLTSIAASPRS